MQAPSISIRLSRPNGSVIQHCSAVLITLEKNGFAFTDDSEVIDHRMRVYQDARGRFVTGDLIYLGGSRAEAVGAFEKVCNALGPECVNGESARVYDETRGHLWIVGAPTVAS